MHESLPMNTIQVILVEDQQLLRAGVKYHLNRCSDIEVVAEAENLQQAQTQIAEHQPNVILLDITLGDENGLDLIPHIREVAPQAHALVLTGHNSRDWIDRCIQTGCAGFLDKSAIADEVASAVRAVHSGRKRGKCNQSRRGLSERTFA